MHLESGMANTGLRVCKNPFAKKCQLCQHAWTFGIALLVENLRWITSGNDPRRWSAIPRRVFRFFETGHSCNQWRNGRQAESVGVLEPEDNPEKLEKPAKPDY